MQMIKNSKSQICNFRSYIDVDIKKEMEDITKIMEVVHQKLIENTGIPRNILQIDLANPEGDIGTETLWCGYKIVDFNRIKFDEKDT